jgi:hypothetical protein
MGDEEGVGGGFKIMGGRNVLLNATSTTRENTKKDRQVERSRFFAHQFHLHNPITAIERMHLFSLPRRVIPRCLKKMTRNCFDLGVCPLLRWAVGKPGRPIVTIGVLFLSSFSLFKILTCIVLMIKVIILGSESLEGHR